MGLESPGWGGDLGSPATDMVNPHAAAHAVGLDGHQGQAVVQGIRGHIQHAAAVHLDRGNLAVVHHIHLQTKVNAIIALANSISFS